MRKVIYLEDYQSKEFNLQFPTIDEQELEFEAAYDELNNRIPDPHEWDEYFEEMKRNNHLTSI